jgi:Transglutaminase-like superfamily
VNPVAAYLRLKSTQRRLLNRTALVVGGEVLASIFGSDRFRSERMARRLRSYRSTTPAATLSESSDLSQMPESAAEIIRFVRAIGRRVRKVNCLVQGYSAFRLLEQEGVPVELRIGVATPRAGSMSAHAWLLWRGNVVLGGEVALEQFVPIVVFASHGTMAGK